MSKLKVYVGASNQARPHDVNNVIAEIQARGHEVIKWNKGYSYSNDLMLSTDLIVFVPPYGTMHRTNQDIIVGAGQYNQLEALYAKDREEDVFFAMINPYGDLDLRQAMPGCWSTLKYGSSTQFGKVPLRSVQSMDSVFVDYERKGSKFLVNSASKVSFTADGTLAVPNSAMFTVTVNSDEPLIAGAVLLGLI